MMLAGLLFLSALATGCNVQDDYRYASKGIGTTLYTGGISQRLRLEGMYFGYLCGKAGLPSSGGGAGGLPICQYEQFGDTDWNNMVQAGMNDIDERCDAFLAWHDERKRSGPALSGQLNTTSQFVQAIIEIYEPTALAIKVVSHAFGFAIDSLDTYNQRLLFQIDTSTLQSLVITRQQKFRTQLADARINFTGKPSVEHALRSYLRICMPMTIETEINNVLTVFDRTGVGPAQDMTSVITTDAAIRATREPVKSVEPVRRTDRGERGTEGAISETEKRADRAQAKAIQRALCLDDDGVLGASTRVGIMIFEIEFNRGQSGPTVNGDLNDEELGELLSAGACPQGFKNYLERSQFKSEANLKALNILLVAHYPAVQIGQTLAEMRPHISNWRKELGLDNGPGGMLSDQITRKFLNKIDFFG